MLDVAKARGTEPIPSDYLINVDDLVNCSKREHLSILADDVVLIRTGKGAFWNDETNYLEYPGLGPDAVMWLAEKRIFALGVDAISPDHPEHGTDPTDTEETRIAHRELLINRGIYIMENVALEDIAEDKCYSFLFVALPLKFVGSTGSPLRPIAIVPSDQ